MTRKTKNDWIMEGFKILDEVGAAGLKIDDLTKRLQVTKGSFYHHFENLRHFKRSLLDFFEHAGTQQIIDLAEQSESAAQKIERIAEATLSDATSIEAAVRAWALQDELAQTYQERIDQRRIVYLQELFMEITGDESKAVVMAQTMYAIYIGSLQFFPPLSREQLRNLYDEFKQRYQIA